MIEEGRKINTIRNTVVEITAYAITTILSLVSRLIIINYIGVEFLGLNGFYSSVIAVLSVTELGFSSVMWYFLYEPVKKNDTEKIKSIVNLAKKVYLGVAIIILALSLILTPFLKYFVTTTIDIRYVQVYFLVYAISSAASYLVTYKSVLLGANQRDFVDKLYSLVSSIVTTVLQIVVLIFLRSYLLFLLVRLFTTIIRNVALNQYVNNKYPYIKNKQIQKLTTQEKKEISKKVGALFFHKIGSVISNSIDNILITAFISITIVGYYSNYTLILTTVATIIIKSINGSCASVGNLWVSESKERVESVFNKVYFLEYWMIVFCASAVFALTEDFISLVFGPEFKLGQISVALVTLIFYFTKLNLSIGVFKDAKGLFWNDRFRPLIESVVNIVVSIIALKFWGLNGILFGTLVSSLITVWVEPYILYKKGFEKSPKKYFVQYILKFILCVIIVGANYLACYFLPTSIGFFILKMLICVTIPNILMLLVYFRSENFKYYFNWILGKVSKLRKSKELGK